ncbi:hypothetical protein [Flammeovirga aprica]|uniref:Uncharacterized protein n=1 Tax=Flammeovirga aprica JL-4 TaxID=694437 RepID=A0A7X9RZU6_9BACT|nr:hypothetical protein [Flammeovirga aprica]NME71662.1 hypothetical protein [Flammeovirga aprica JL-4]
MNLRKSILLLHIFFTCFLGCKSAKTDQFDNITFHSRSLSGKNFNERILSQKLEVSKSKEGVIEYKYLMEDGSTSEKYIYQNKHLTKDSTEYLYFDQKKINIGKKEVVIERFLNLYKKKYWCISQYDTMAIIYFNQELGIVNTLHPKLFPIEDALVNHNSLTKRKLRKLFYNMAEDTLFYNPNLKGISIEDLNIKGIPIEDEFEVLLESAPPCTSTIDSITQTVIYENYDIGASPKNGLGSFYKKIGQRIKYTSNLKKYGIDTRLYLGFIVHADSSVSGFREMRGDEKMIANIDELYNLTSEIEWVPAQCDGKEVPSLVVLPIRICLK